MTRPTSPASEVVVDRRSNDRRRTSPSKARPQGEHRTADHPESQPRQSERRKVERRRQIDPTTCERDYTPDQVDFMKAMDLYKRRSGRQFPTWSEVLEVLENLGYRKVATPTEIYQRVE